MAPVLYPNAVWSPLQGHSATGTVSQRNQCILHITDGTNASSAINTFKASVAPNRTSAHFVIDRDGTIYQLLSISDTAWHASQANSHSIGVEHAAMSQDGADALNIRYAAQIKAGTQVPFCAMPATDEQYAASAMLVKWLCEQMKVPCNRAHVRTHNEASPADGHVLCCTGALDPDRVVQLANIPT